MFAFETSVKGINNYSWNIDEEEQKDEDHKDEAHLLAKLQRTGMIQEAENSAGSED